MLGISYYATNQWRVAAKHPPHLAAIIPWEGRNDNYRDCIYHGGILSEFQERWAKHQVVNVQYGRGEKAKKNPNTGESIAGPSHFPTRNWPRTAYDVFEESRNIPLDDEWHRERSADLSQGDRPVADLRQLGRTGHPPARQFQRLHRTRHPSRSGWRRTATPTGRFSRAAMGLRCRSASSTIS